MIYVRGAGSAIVSALQTIYPAIVPVARGEQMPTDSGYRYLFCVGLLYQKPTKDQTKAEIDESFAVNCSNVTRECDRLLDVNPRARICVIGSEAAYTGSFDETYATAKRNLQRYVESKRLKHQDQQIVCIAPTVIMDTGMTNARNEDGWLALGKRRAEHPKQRFLDPMEVARMIHFLLVVDRGYTTNVTIRLNGGEHCA